MLHLTGMAPSGDCRHNHGGLSDNLVHRSVQISICLFFNHSIYIYEHLVHKSVVLQAFDLCLLRSKPPDPAGNHWTISHSSRFHRTKGVAPFALECHKYHKYHEYKYHIRLSAEISLFRYWTGFSSQSLGQMRRKRIWRRSGKLI